MIASPPFLGTRSFKLSLGAVGRLPRRRARGTSFLFPVRGCSWDVITGQQVAVYRHHRSVVRDCDWHPHRPLLATVG